MKYLYRYVVLPSLFIAVTSLLNACSSAINLVREIENTRIESKGVYTIEIGGRWTDDLPEGASIQIQWESPHQVWLVDRDKKIELGNLTYQFPDTPVKTLLLDTGSDAFVFGWVDDTVEGIVDFVNVCRYKSDDEVVRKATCKINKINPEFRIISLPIFSRERNEWKKIEEIRISREREEGVEIKAGYRSILSQRYEPAVELDELLVIIPSDVNE